MKVSDRQRDPWSGESSGGGGGLSWREGASGDPAAGFPARAPANQCAADEETVAAAASTVVVKIPTWFTAAAALRVARLKDADHLLVVDRQQLVGSVSADVLASARPHQPVAPLMDRHTVVVRPDMPLSDAWRLMDSHGLSCLPVVSGGLLLGVLYRQTDLAFAS
jgi:acetoin utilization protein AcuB